MGVAALWDGWQRGARNVPGPLASSHAANAIVRWSGDGLAAGTAIDTSTIGPGDTPFTTATASTFTVDASGRIQMDQQAATAAVLTWNTAFLFSLNAYPVRMYLEMTALPSAGAPIVQAFGSGNSILRWRLDITSTGLIRLRDDANNIVDTSVLALAIATRYRIEVTVNDTSARAYVYAGDSTTALLTLAGTVGSTCDAIRFGNSQTSPTWPRLYMDDLAVGRGGPELIGPVVGAYTDPGLAEVYGVGAELLIDEAWVDITSDVRYAQSIKITRGRSSETRNADPQTCSLTLDNRLGKYSPRNPVGPYYGKIGRNTPLRVWVSRNEIRYYRFYGEISSWPPEWDITGREAIVSVTASGMMRRLVQGDSPLRSALYRGISTETVNPPVAYWPCEDGENSSVVSSAVAGVRAMDVMGTATFASESGFAASDALPKMGTAKFTGYPGSYTVTGTTQIRLLIAVPAAGVADGQGLLRLHGTGSANLWDLLYRTASGGSVELLAQNNDGTTVSLNDTTGTVTGLNLNGAFKRLSVEITTSGSNSTVRIQAAVPGSAGTAFNDTLNSATLGRITSMIVGADQGLGDTAVGHISVQTAQTSLADYADEFNAWNDEAVLARFERLCAEEGVNYETRTGGNDVTTMGYQKIGTLLDLLRETADSDLGMLLESREQLALRFRDRTSLYSQDPAVTLDCSAHQMDEQIKPVEDDQAARNDITVVRRDGASSRAVLEEGPLSVQAPPDGIGRVDETVTLSLGTDDQTADQAAWRLHLGTTDEARYSKIQVALHNPSMAGIRHLVLAADIGDRIVVQDPPPGWPPDDISQLVQGYTETINQFMHTIEFSTSPESPWRVGIADDPDSRADTDGSELTADITDSATSFQVTVTDGPLWTTNVSHFPFDVKAGGERMTVTAISGASSPQTFTVTRSVNGVTKAHLAGTALGLADPVYAAL